MGVAPEKRPIIDTGDRTVRRAVIVAAASAAFVALTWAGILGFAAIQIIISLNDTTAEDIRTQHIRQHADEQVKYDEMIRLLDEIRRDLAAER